MNTPADEASTPSTPRVQLYILSYNRPEYVRQSVDSAFRQDYPIEIIVSDNSTSNSVAEALDSYIGRANYSYLRRQPSLPALEHFNLVMQETNAEFFMMFHDDDILLSGTISTQVKALQLNQKAVACGGNAILIEASGERQGLFHTRLLTDHVITTVNELARHYLNFDLGHAPFPSYLYRRSKVEGLTMEFRQGRKHADVSFLLKVAKRGPLLWLSQPLMLYRKHGGNDSFTIDIVAVISLCRFIKKLKAANGAAIRHYKLINFVAWRRQRSNQSPAIASKSIGKWREHIIANEACLAPFRYPDIFVSHFIGKLRRKMYALLQKPNHQ